MGSLITVKQVLRGMSGLFDEWVESLLESDPLAARVICTKLSRLHHAADEYAQANTWTTRGVEAQRFIDTYINVEDSTIAIIEDDMMLDDDGYPLNLTTANFENDGEETEDLEALEVL